MRSLNRIEFLVTLACSGRCKHCSEGEHSSAGEHIDGGVAAEMVRMLAGRYSIESMLTFGGEPLLHPEEVCKIHEAARAVAIPRRQLITNGFFSRDGERIKAVAAALCESGVNDIMLSVDAFHQETIPLEPVMEFARAVQATGVPKLRVHPAWLVSEDADNPYNDKTRDILVQFNALGIPTSGGNVIFPGGNALKYLSEYFDLSVPAVSPYAEDPQDITAICVSPNGAVLGGNIYRESILNILANYAPPHI